MPYPQDYGKLPGFQQLFKVLESGGRKVTRTAWLSWNPFVALCSREGSWCPVIFSYVFMVGLHTNSDWLLCTFCAFWAQTNKKWAELQANEFCLLIMHHESAPGSLGRGETQHPWHSAPSDMSDMSVVSEQACWILTPHESTSINYSQKYLIEWMYCPSVYSCWNLLCFRIVNAN